MAKKKLTIEDVLVPKEEIPYEVPENWCWITFESVIDNVSSSKKKIKQKDYLEEGKFPIIDQGANMIGGYTNYEELLYDGELPVIIFGDHTRCVKYIDFKFAQGADGVKVLKVKQGLNPMYIYYLMLNLELPNKGYSRHYKFLRDSKLQIPPLAEQERIVNRIESLFEKVDKASELVEEAREGFEKRRAAILEKAFSGELTKSWREKHGISFEWRNHTLGNIIKEGPQNGLYKPKSAYGEGNLIVRIDNFYDGVINPWDTLKRLQLNDKDIDLYSLDNGDFLVNRVNSIDYLGKSALVRGLNEISVFESNVMRFKINDDINKEYIIKYMNSPIGLRELRKNAKHAVNQASINQQDVKSANIILPSIEEQNEIVRILDLLIDSDRDAYDLSKINNDIDIIKKSILAKAFRSELGSNDLNEKSSIALLKEIIK